MSIFVNSLILNKKDPYKKKATVHNLTVFFKQNIESKGQNEKIITIPRKLTIHCFLCLFL